MINNQTESVSFYSFCLALYFCATSILYTWLFWISRSSTNLNDNQELKEELRKRKQKCNELRRCLRETQKTLQQTRKRSQIDPKYQYLILRYSA